MKSRLLNTIGTLAIIFFCTSNAFSTTNEITSSNTNKQEIIDKSQSNSKFFSRLSTKVKKSISKIKEETKKNKTDEGVGKWFLYTLLSALAVFGIGWIGIWFWYYEAVIFICLGLIALTIIFGLVCLFIGVRNWIRALKKNKTIKTKKSSELR